MSEQTSEILELRRTVTALSNRLGLLERRVSSLEPASQGTVRAPESVVPPASAPVDASLAVSTPLAHPVSTPVDLPQDHDSQCQRGKTAEESEAEEESPVSEPRALGVNLEQWLGLYGLSRIGIASLVLGLALLILHSWDNFGPVLKIAFGLFSGLALIGAGEHLSRKERLEWYGLGIVGGGYSICYFTTYAMQNIASVQILHNPLLDSCLLLGVAAVAMVHSVKKRSEIVALLSTILAFWTISLSEINLFSVLAAALLVCGIAWVVLRMRWNNVLAVSALASYLTFSLFSSPNINPHGELLPAEAFFVAFGMLAVYWLGYNAVLLLQKRENNEADKLYSLGVMVLNAAGFQMLVLTEMHAAFPEWKWLFLAGLGVYYLMAGRVFSRREQHSLSTVCSFVGLQGITAAIPLKLNKEAISAAWFLEIALLGWLGTDLRRPSFRLFALLLTGLVWLRFLMFDLPNDRLLTTLGLPVDYRLLVGIIGIAALGSVAYVYRQYKANLLDFEQKMAYQLYFATASTVAWHLVVALAAPNMVPVYFAAIGLGMALLGMRVDKFVQVVAAAFFVNVFLYTPWIAHDAPLLNLLATVAMFYLTAVLFNINKTVEPMWRRGSYQLYFFSATALTWIIAAVRVEAHLAPLAVGLISLAVLLLGVKNADKPMRHFACLGFLTSALGLLTASFQWNWYNTLPVVAVIYVASFVYRWLPLQERNVQTGFDQIVHTNGERSLFLNGYGIIANVLLTSVFASNLHAQWLTAGWALEGIALVGLGLSMWDKMFRISGLAVFALLVGKLLFVDLSGADTVGRIAGFIVAGIVLLAASYAYNWFVRKVETGQT